MEDAQVFFEEISRSVEWNDPAQLQHFRYMLFPIMETFMEESEELGSVGTSWEGTQGHREPPAVEVSACQTASPLEYFDDRLTPDS